MLFRTEEHLSFQKGIALAGAYTPYHVMSLKQPNHMANASLEEPVCPAARGKENKERSLHDFTAVLHCSHLQYSQVGCYTHFASYGRRLRK